jgi:hypothetical protein
MNALLDSRKWTVGFIAALEPGKYIGKVEKLGASAPLVSDEKDAALFENEDAAYRVLRESIIDHFSDPATARLYVKSYERRIENLVHQTLCAIRIDERQEGFLLYTNRGGAYTYRLPDDQKPHRVYCIGKPEDLVSYRIQSIEILAPTPQTCATCKISTLRGFVILGWFGYSAQYAEFRRAVQ